MEKKRAMIMVDKEAWEGIQALLKESNVHPQFFNEMLNMFIREQYNLLKGIVDANKKNGKLTTADFYQLIGQMIGNLGKYEDEDK
jgi:hypothetical protein